MCVCASVFVCQKGCQTTCLMYIPHIRLAKKRSRIKSGQKNPYNEIANNANAQQTHSHESRCKMRPVELTNQKKKNEKAIKKKDIKTKKQTTKNKRKTKLVSCQRAEEAKGCVAPYLISGNFFLEQTLDQKARETMPELRSSLARRI